MDLQPNQLPEPLGIDHPPGTIIIASGELSRYPAFAHSLVDLLRPKGTHMEWCVGLNVAANFNLGARHMIGEWIWIMGDDHEFEPTTLMRLLERDVDVVVPLVVRRQPPFIPVVFKSADHITPTEHRPGGFPPYHWSEIPLHGLMEVKVAGSAGMLIRKRVLDALPRPLFETGKHGADSTNEDTYLSKKIQDAGFKIHVDADVQMGHWTPMALWPARLQTNEWTIGIHMGDKVRIVLPTDHAVTFARPGTDQQPLHRDQPERLSGSPGEEPTIHKGVDDA